MNTTEIGSTRSTWARPAALVLLASAAFLLATVLTVGYRVQTVGPVAEDEAARQVLAWGLVLTGVGAIALRVRGRPDQHEAFARASLLATGAGVAGYVAAVLASSRWGLADLPSMARGHLIFGIQPGWGLWAYLLFSAPLVNWASWRAPAPPAWTLASWWPALYLLATGIWETQYRVRGTFGGGHALFALALATGIVAAFFYQQKRRGDGI